MASRLLVKKTGTASENMNMKILTLGRATLAFHDTTVLSLCVETALSAVLKALALLTMALAQCRQSYHLTHSLELSQTLLSSNGINYSQWAITMVTTVFVGKMTNI